MSIQYQLRDPVFVKIRDIKPGEDGFNIYAKVLEHSVEQVTTGSGSVIKKTVVKLADQSGSAVILKKDAVIAVRNGISAVIKDHIQVRIDKFGKLTAESRKIQPKAEPNISAKEYQLKKEPYDDRRDRRNDRRRR